MQEAMLPPSIICFYGDVWLPWTSVTRIALEISGAQLQLDFDEPLITCFGTTHMGLVSAARLSSSHASRSARPLSTLLLCATTRECSEPRDYLYALLGLLDDSVRRDILVDYGKSFEDVLVEASRIAIHHDRSLRILTIPSNRELPEVDTQCRLPSWAVPLPYKARAGSPIPSLRCPMSLSSLFDLIEAPSAKSDFAYRLKVRGLVVYQIDTDPIMQVN